MQMPIPDDWDFEACCRWVVYWPNSPKWLAILHGLIEQPSQGRYWDADSGNIVSTQNSFRSFYDHNFSLEEVLMSCDDTQLVAAFNSIAAALRTLAANQCCESGIPENGGVMVVINSNEGVQTPIYGTEPPGEVAPGEVPPDFSGTREEYDIEKCNLSAGIVDGWANTLDNLSFINFAQSIGLSALVVAALAGFITLPVTLIPTLIAAAIVLVAVRQMLRDLAGLIRDNKQQIVCILYESDSAQEIIAAYSDTLDLLIAAIPATGAVAFALKTIALILANSNTLNKLFNLSQGSAPDYDCSNCGCTLFTLETGNGILVDQGTDWIEVQGQYDGTRYDAFVFINWDYSGGVPCGPSLDITGIDVISGSITGGGGLDIYRIFDENVSVIYTSETTPPTLPFSGGFFIAIASTTAFTVKYTVDLGTE